MQDFGHPGGGWRKKSDHKFRNPVWQQIQQSAPTLRDSCGSNELANPGGDTAPYVEPEIPARISISLVWLGFVDVKIWSQISKYQMVANPRGFVLSNLVGAWNKRRREKEKILSFPTVPVPASNSFRQPRTRVLKIIKYTFSKKTDQKSDQKRAPTFPEFSHLRTWF